VLRSLQRIRWFACLQDCLLTLTCHLAHNDWYFSTNTNFLIRLIFLYKYKLPLFDVLFAFVCFGWYLPGRISPISLRNMTVDFKSWNASCRGSNGWVRPPSCCWPQHPSLSRPVPFKVCLEEGRNTPRPHRRPAFLPCHHDSPPFLPHRYSRPEKTRLSRFPSKSPVQNPKHMKKNPETGFEFCLERWFYYIRIKKDERQGKNVTLQLWCTVTR
jgi:hypothetical protein